MARLTNLHPNGHPCEASVIVTSECEVALWRDLFNPNPWDLPTVFPWEDGHLCGKHLNHRDLHHPRHGKWIAIHLAPVRSLHHWRVILGIKFHKPTTSSIITLGISDSNKCIDSGFIIIDQPEHSWNKAIKTDGSPNPTPGLISQLMVHQPTDLQGVAPKR